MFHISKTGQAKPCTAQPDNCPLGGQHYESQEAAARALREQRQSQSVESWEEGSITVRPLPGDFAMSDNRAVLPPGRYFLGDPCYTAGKDDTAWQEWVDVAYAPSGNGALMGGTYNGHPVIASSTEYGDGTYYGSNGVDYSVDAGIIGVVPEAVIQGMKLTDADLEGSGSWVTVEQPTALEYEDGTIFFGSVAIHTGDDPEEEEEEFYCERCGTQLDNEWDSLCGNCADEDGEEDQ